MRHIAIVLFAACMTSIAGAQVTTTPTTNPNIATTRNLNTIKVVQPPTLAEVTKMVYDLQQANTKLQEQVTALQKQVNANYKVQDFMLGNLMKKADEAVKRAEIVGFTITAGPGNLADPFQPPTNYGPSTYYNSVIIDNAACNGNPDAVINVVPQSSNFGYNLPIAVALRYDKSIAKWKIWINPHITNSMILGKASPYTGSSYVSVLGYLPYEIFKGDKFNVLVIKPTD